MLCVSVRKLSRVRQGSQERLLQLIWSNADSALSSNVGCLRSFFPLEMLVQAPFFSIKLYKLFTITSTEWLMHSVLSSASIKGTLTAAIEVRLQTMHTHNLLSISPICFFCRLKLSKSFVAGKARARLISFDLGAEWCYDIWQGLLSTRLPIILYQLDGASIHVTIWKYPKPDVLSVYNSFL
jgi:hypothetical protein